MNSRNPPNGNELLAKQLTMTYQTWERLRFHGVDEASELRLDFYYNAPSRSAAAALEDLLRKETDYDVAVVANRDVWGVRGRTQSTQISEAILLEWVRWMVAAGLQYDVVFDGWGAQVPR